MTAPQASPGRRPLFKHPWRVAIVAIGLLLVVNLAILAAHNTDTRQGGRDPLPVTIESISPERGALTGPIDDVTVDLENSLTGVLVIDGVEIPEDQTDRVVELGQVSFRPGPDKEFTKLPVGDNTVVVKYWPRVKSRPANPPSFSWRFNVAA